MSKKREVIELNEEDFQKVINDDLPEHLLIEEMIEKFDEQEAFVTIQFIIRRESDNKFFQGSYEQWLGGDAPKTFPNLKLTEVFAKRTTRQVYE